MFFSYIKMFHYKYNTDSQFFVLVNFHHLKCQQNLSVELYVDKNYFFATFNFHATKMFNSNNF